MKETLRKLLVYLIEYIDGIQIQEFQRRMAEANGEMLDMIDQERASYQNRCNHMKGGVVRPSKNSKDIAEGLLHGNGSQYSVRKHMMMNRDVWVDCLRCGMKWRPPVRAEFKTDREFYKAVEEYDRAVAFPTNNVMSSSILCQFTDRKTGRDANGTVRKMYAAIGA